MRQTLAFLNNLRRGYAKNLLEKGTNLDLISKALGHSNLAVTTQYLDLDVEEVADNLRNFLHGPANKIIDFYELFELISITEYG